MEWNKVAPVNRQNPNSVVCVCRLYHIPNKCLRLKVINSPRGIGRELPTDAEPCFYGFCRYLHSWNLSVSLCQHGSDGKQHKNFSHQGR